MDMPAIFLLDGTSGDIRAVLRSIQAQMWEHAQRAAFNEEETVAPEHDIALFLALGCAADL